MVPKPDRVISRMTKKWRKMREKSAKYEDTKAILDELEEFLPAELLDSVDETLDTLSNDLDADEPYVQAKFEVFFATIAELMREHAKNSPENPQELERVLEMTKRWPKERMKSSKAGKIRDVDEEKAREEGSDK